MSDVESVEYESDEENEVTEDEDEEEETEARVVRKRKPKKKKDPNKPKRNMSAFFLYSNEHRSRIRQENPDVKFGDIAKILSTEFRALGAKEKKKYEKLAEKDKARYQKEMESYEPPSEESDSDSDGGYVKKKKKRKPDPNKPKRNLSAYFIYSCAIRETVQRENPEAKFGDIARIISKRFKALPADERAIYDEKAAEDKERYKIQMKEYNGV